MLHPHVSHHIAYYGLLIEGFPQATHLRRIFSCILSSFSWNWDGIVIDPQDFGKVAERLRHKVLLPPFSPASVL